MFNPTSHATRSGTPYSSFWNGTGLVEVMVRHSGFIACSASRALNDANFVLIPEVPFKLDGDLGLSGLGSTGQPPVFA